jgi:hypothetical protein
MNNIASLAEALEKLGFDDSLHTTLHTYSSLILHKFNVHTQAVKERDVLKFNLFFQRKENAYSCLYYDAILRKEIVVQNIVVDGIHIKDLDEKMEKIDWKNLFDKEQHISSIINDLKTLDATKEGKQYSDQLKVKHWSDTPLENIMGISFTKSRFEIAQRFYFLENGNGISIEEAYRFLNNKWMEKQLRKKPATNVVAETKAIDKSKAKKKKEKN